MVLDVDLGVLLGVLGGAVGVGLAWAFKSRQKPVKANVDVDELAVEVAKLGKVVRRINMQTVRAAAGDGAEPPAGFIPSIPQPEPDSKEALRNRVFGRRA